MTRRRESYIISVMLKNIRNITQLIVVNFIYGNVYIYDKLLLDGLYNCCFGIKRNRVDNVRSVIELLKNLSEEEFKKVMNRYNNN